ncbi:MAG: hypothetical protein U0234_22910 [Sandaracinus sp.]
MSILELLPNTAEHLLSRIDARTELKLRRELRRLQRDVGLLFVGLWVSSTRGDVLIEFAGESAIAPQRYPFITTSAPTLEPFRGSDGEDHEAVVYRPRLGRGMPQLGLLAADVRGLDASPLYDAVEGTGDAVEEILVATLV